MATRSARGSFVLAAVVLFTAPACSSDAGKGCSSGTDDSVPEETGGDLDSDNDRLTNWDENNVYHTDPHNPDTDGDGYTDGEEVLDYGTNPNNVYSHPYTGDYKFGECDKYPTDGGPTGSHNIPGGGIAALYEAGDTIRNEQLVDQYGEPVDLYSFCGVNFDLLFLQLNQYGAVSEYGALTCWINDMKNVQSFYRDYGYQLMIVLTQGSGVSLPTTSELSALGTMMLGTDLDQVPILASRDESITGFHTWFEVDFHEPTLVHIGPDLRVLSVDKDDCSGADRDPCPYMGTAVPEGKCWENPDPDCEPIDAKQLWCACPAPACEDYCGEGNCPQTW